MGRLKPDIVRERKVVLKKKKEIEQKAKMGGSAFPDTERLSETEYQRVVSQVRHSYSYSSENNVDLFYRF